MKDENNDMNRRRFLAVSAVSVASTATLAGCSASGGANNDGEPTAEFQPENGEETETPGYGQNVGQNAIGWSVDYIGEWHGSISTDGQQQSIEGYGMKQGNITPPPNYASITAQKEDTGMDTLSVKFFYDGEVIQESSTTAEYGVVTASVSNQ